jgi:hypothetical protein
MRVSRGSTSSPTRIPTAISGAGRKSPYRISRLLDLHKLGKKKMHGYPKKVRRQAGHRDSIRATSIRAEKSFAVRIETSSGALRVSPEE